MMERVLEGDGGGGTGGEKPSVEQSVEQRGGVRGREDQVPDPQHRWWGESGLHENAHTPRSTPSSPARLRGIGNILHRILPHTESLPVFVSQGVSHSLSFRRPSIFFTFAQGWESTRAVHGLTISAMVQARPRAIYLQLQTC